jgi:hypothetical protein
MAEWLVISRNDQLNKIVNLVIKLCSETLYYYVINDHLTHTGTVSAPFLKQITYVYVLWEEVGLKLTVSRALRLRGVGNCFKENLVMLSTTFLYVLASYRFPNICVVCQICIMLGSMCLCEQLFSLMKQNGFGHVRINRYTFVNNNWCGISTAFYTWHW